LQGRITDTFDRAVDAVNEQANKDLENASSDKEREQIIKRRDKEVENLREVEGRLDSRVERTEADIRGRVGEISGEREERAVNRQFGRTEERVNERLAAIEERYGLNKTDGAKQVDDSFGEIKSDISGKFEKGRETLNETFGSEIETALQSGDRRKAESLAKERDQRLEELNKAEKALQKGVDGFSKNLTDELKKDDGQISTAEADGSAKKIEQFGEFAGKAADKIVSALAGDSNSDDNVTAAEGPRFGRRGRGFPGRIVGAVFGRGRIGEAVNNAQDRNSAAEVAKNGAAAQQLAASLPTADTAGEQTQALNRFDQSVESADRQADKNQSKLNRLANVVNSVSGARGDRVGRLVNRFVPAITNRIEAAAQQPPEATTQPAQQAPARPDNSAAVQQGRRAQAASQYQTADRIAQEGAGNERRTIAPLEQSQGAERPAQPERESRERNVERRERGPERRAIGRRSSRERQEPREVNRDREVQRPEQRREARGPEQTREIDRPEPCTTT
jgi:hypothetical protein